MTSSTSKIASVWPMSVVGHPAFDEIVHPLVVRLFGGVATKNLAKTGDPELLRGRKRVIFYQPPRDSTSNGGVVGLEQSLIQLDSTPGITAGRNDEP